MLSGAAGPAQPQRLAGPAGVRPSSPSDATANRVSALALFFRALKADLTSFKTPLRSDCHGVNPVSSVPTPAGAHAAHVPGPPNAAAPRVALRALIARHPEGSGLMCAFPLLYARYACLP